MRTLNYFGKLNSLIYGEQNMKPFLLAVAGALTMCSVQAMAAETYTLDLINNNTRCDLEYKLPSNG